MSRVKEQKQYAPILKGKQGEDIQTFFNRYDQYAIELEWNEEKKIGRLPVYLKHNAWEQFMSIENVETLSWNELKTELTDKIIDSPAYLTTIGELDEVLQRSTETAVQYYDRLRKLVMITYPKRNLKSAEAEKEILARYIKGSRHRRDLNARYLDDISDAITISNNLDKLDKENPTGSQVDTNNPINTATKLIRF